MNWIKIGADLINLDDLSNIELNDDGSIEVYHRSGELTYNLEITDDEKLELMRKVGLT